MNERCERRADLASQRTVRPTRTGPRLRLPQLLALTTAACALAVGATSDAAPPAPAELPRVTVATSYPAGGRTVRVGASGQSAGRAGCRAPRRRAAPSARRDLRRQLRAAQLRRDAERCACRRMDRRPHRRPRRRARRGRHAHDAVARHVAQARADPVAQLLARHRHRRGRAPLAHSRVWRSTSRPA